MKMEVIHGSRVVPKAEQQALLVGVSERFNARRLQRRMERTRERLKHSPERQSVAIAMLAVEERIVEAYWVLARSTSNPVPRRQSVHGVSYMLEREDKWAAAVAGGGWLSDPPKSPPASASEVDRADEALEWLQLVGEPHRSIVSAGTRSKSGDVERKVNWFRVRAQLPAYADLSADKLNRLYREGLRIIASQVRTQRYA